MEKGEAMKYVIKKNGDGYQVLSHGICVYDAEDKEEAQDFIEHEKAAIANEIE